MTVLPKAIYRFNAIPVKSPVTSIPQLEQNIFYTLYQNTKTQRPTSILREKKGVEGIKLPDFKLCYKGRVIKTV